MTLKNVIGTYNKKDVYPEFGYETEDTDSIAAPTSISSLAPVSRVNHIVGRVDPINQWRAFSERLRNRRLAHEHLDSDEKDLPREKRAAPNISKNPPRAKEQQFQRTYEQDMVNIKSNSDPMVLGLQRYLSLVNHPLPDEHLKAYESPDIDDSEHVEQGEAGSEKLAVLRVQDVMTRKVVCVIESTTIEQVASICNRRGFSGVPVIDERQSLVGIVTLTDIVNQLFTHRSISYYSEQGGKVLEQKALAILDEPVRNYMHKDVITVSPDTPVKEACAVMMRHNIRRVVVARGDIVRGIFSAQDAVKVLAAAHLNVAE